MVYGGEYGMSDYLELLSEVLDGGDAEYWMIGDT